MSDERPIVCPPGFSWVDRRILGELAHVADLKALATTVCGLTRPPGAADLKRSCGADRACPRCVDLIRDGLYARAVEDRVSRGGERWPRVASKTRGAICE